MKINFLKSLETCRTAGYLQSCHPVGNLYLCLVLLPDGRKLSTPTIRLQIGYYLWFRNRWANFLNSGMLQSSGAYTQVITRDKKSHISTKKLGEFETLLDSDLFFRSTKTEIINLRYLRGLNRAENYEIHLEGDLVFKVSSSKRDEFNKRVSMLSISG
jgi:LytTr DNA-binding domain